MATTKTLAAEGAQPILTARRRRVRLLRRAQRVLAHVLLLVAGACFLFPLLWLISTSLKSNTQMFAYPPIWIPVPAYWSNYPDAVNFMPIFLYLKNTLTICL